MEEVWTRIGEVIDDVICFWIILHVLEVVYDIQGWAILKMYAITHESNSSWVVRDDDKTLLRLISSSEPQRKVVCSLYGGAFAENAHFLVNVVELEISVYSQWHEAQMASVAHKLQKLQSLTLKWNPCGLFFPPNVETLTITGDFEGRWEDLSKFKRLKKLRINVSTIDLLEDNFRVPTTLKSLRMGVVSGENNGVHALVAMLLDTRISLERLSVMLSCDADVTPLFGLPSLRALRVCGWGAIPYQEEECRMNARLIKCNIPLGLAERNVRMHKAASDAAVCAFLLLKQPTFLIKDIAKMIANLVFASRFEIRTWESAVSDDAFWWDKSDPSKCSRMSLINKPLY